MGSPPIASRSKPVHVTLYDSAARGGICHYTFHLAESLALAGCRVTLLTSHDYELVDRPRHFDLVYIFKPSWIRSAISWLIRYPPRAEKLSQGAATVNFRESGTAVRAEPSGAQRLRMRLLMLRAAARIFLSGSKVVHMQWGADRREDLRFLGILKRLGIRTVYTAHDLMPHEEPKPGDAESLARLYRAVDRVVVFAEATRRELVESFGLDENRVVAIPHGGDGLLFDFPSQEAARHELRIAADRKVILFFGHIRRYKGLEYLVEAFEKTRATVKDALLLIAGSLSDVEAGEREQYSSLLAGLRDRADVVCVCEYIPVERVGLFYAAADVVVLPYVRTYHSGILMTAYAAGKPVVVTDTGSLAEDVREGSTGFVVPPKNVGALADRIEAVLVRPDRGRSMGNTARRLATSTYSWSAVAEKTTRVYRALVDRSFVQDDADGEAHLERLETPGDRPVGGAQS